LFTKILDAVPFPHHETLAGFFSAPFEGGNKSGNVTRWGYIFFYGELDQLPRDILMNSASKAFGEGAANFGISSEPVTAYHVFEHVIFRFLPRSQPV
jgi:hypothetical protein